MQIIYSELKKTSLSPPGAPLKNVKQISGDFQGCRGCLQKLCFGPRNDPAWMPGLGEGHHGCVYDEPDTGTGLTTHRDDGN